MSLETIYEAVLNGDAKQTEAEVKAALEANVSAADILHKACIPAMDEVGHLFEISEKFVPEMLISARAMQTALNILKPLLA
jgi:5-methyltetrahydrofolate--homocysteine methyltransferase